MMDFRQRFCVLAGVFALLSALVSAQNTTVVAASTFYLEETETQFSVNIANDSSDVNIYFTSPAYSWVGFGFGEKMANSLMFIMYPNSDGDNVTLSPRLGNPSSEPTFTPSLEITALPSTRINDSMLIAHIRCSDCRTYLDPISPVQPMIYAFGPGNRLLSDSPSANLKRHVRYGQFTMNMLAATGSGGVPAKSNAVNGVSIPDGGMVRDHDRKNLAHAILGCVVLFVLWPLNVIFAGFFKSRKVHLGGCVLVMTGLVVSYALGGVTSAQYNRSKDFKTPHQIFAFIAILPILLLGILPLPNLSKLHARIPTLHMPLTSLTFVILVLTGGLGLHLSSQARPIILAYTAIAIMVFLFNTILQSCIRRRGSAHSRAEKRQRKSRQGGEDDDQMVMLGKMEDRSVSETSFGTPYAASYNTAGGSGEFGSHGQEQYQYQQQQQQRSPGRGIYGGGTMPGPQYLLNMHPGVPVQVSRM